MLQDADEAVMRRHGGMYFMTKMRSDNERLLAQNSLDFIAGLIYNIVPQMVNVRRILKARIPIVKFLHSSSGIDCDLCVDNR
jgi:poly(A) RNA polymerase